MAWQEPKTDWTAQDALNYGDYNRIKNNLEYLHGQAAIEWGDFEIEDMGADLPEPTRGGGFVPYDAKYFNAFESNVDTINGSMLAKDYGYRQTFYYNGAFIGYEELNRIEGAILGMKRTLDGKSAGKARLAFRLGAPKGLYL